MGLRRRIRTIVRTASASFRTWNRSRKSAWLRHYSSAHGVDSVLLVGAGGGDEQWENQVERSIADGASFTVWCGSDRRSGLENYIVCDGRALPFRNGSFDLVFSNAVVEHVGDEPDQALFVAEHARAGRWWAATTPNRWFPIESHTLAVFRHWSSGWRDRRPEFTRLLSRNELAQLLPEDSALYGSRMSPTFIAFGPHRRGTEGEARVNKLHAGGMREREVARP